LQKTSYNDLREKFRIDNQIYENFSDKIGSHKTEFIENYDNSRNKWSDLKYIESMKNLKRNSGDKELNYLKTS